MISENRLIIYLCLYSLILVSIDLVYNQAVQGQTFDPIAKNPDIAEDQIITCIKDVSDGPQRGSLICHIFDIDDLDWYQEIQENNYGLLGDLNDSFDMGLID